VVDLPKKFTADPSLVIVKTPMSHPDQAEHDSAIRQLVHRIALNISSVINYDHAEISIPKTDLPLKIGKRRFDIAYETNQHNLILLEVKLVKGWNRSGTSK
jgi:hypothetical protein